ncbi:MAG: hypothetical protein Tsb0020_48130 [Haliangiales bacterium]
MPSPTDDANDDTTGAPTDDTNDARPAPDPHATPTPPRLIVDASDAERADYLQAAVTTVGAIEDAIALLMVRQTIPTLAGDERRLITVKLADLDAHKAKVRAQMHAFIAGQLAVVPPTAGDIKKVQVIAESLDRMTAEAVMTDAVVDATANILALYNLAMAGPPER